MLETMVLTCLEAQLIIRNVAGVEVPLSTKIELMKEVLDRSACKHGDVRLPKVLEGHWKTHQYRMPD